MTNYILVDANNLFHRTKHAGSGDISIRIGMALHVSLNAVRAMWKKFNNGHIVFCLEGGSWRRDIYPKYKAARRVAADLRTSKEKEDDTLLYEAFDSFTTFLRDRTNTTVLHARKIEADDWIAYWIAKHPNDNHIVISNDSDFIQLIAPNVQLYNPLTEKTITENGIIDDKGKKYEFTIANNGKIKIGNINENFKPDNEWWKYALFTKCIRGDSGDGIFPAYPGVRQPRIIEAYEERDTKGFLWNKLMLQSFVNHDGDTVQVKDMYELNSQLIDLTRQPNDIINTMEAVLNEAINKPIKQGIGIWFLKFCTQMGLTNISKNSTEFCSMLSTSYKKK